MYPELDRLKGVALAMACSRIEPLSYGSFHVRRFSHALLVLALTSAAVCEQLPIHAYDTDDGLPSNDIHRIKRDSRGFLWFATNEGLARFNGYEFTNYGRENGLRRDAVFDILETRSGVYWAATSEGVVRFDPDALPAQKFTVYVPPADAGRVYVLYEDRSGQIWTGTKAGLTDFTHRFAPKAAFRLNPSSSLLELATLFIAESTMVMYSNIERASTSGAISCGTRFSRIIEGDFGPALGQGCGGAFCPTVPAITNQFVFMYPGDV